VLTQDLQQFGIKHDISVFAALAALNVYHHALAINVTDLQMCQLGSPYPGGVESHEHNAMEKDVRRVDEPCDFLLTQDRRKTNDLLGIRSFVRTPWLVEGSNEEEAQGHQPLRHCVRGQFSLAEELCLVLADVLLAQLVRRTLEVPCKIFDSADVGSCCTLRVIATLEFLQHHFS
jgi:hypothetical protein